MYNCRKRVAFVVPRYGGKMPDEAEALCVQYAMRLKAYFDVEVLTTCAADHSSWENGCPEGEYNEGEITVRRFLTDHPRDKEAFDNLTQQMYSNPYHDLKIATCWLKEMGPYSTGLMKYIRDNSHSYDAFLFMGHRYYSTTACMPLVAEKSVFVPVTYGDELIRKCNYFQYLYQMPKAILYFSEEERDLVQSVFKNQKVANMVGGQGVEISKWRKKEEIANINLRYKIGDAPYLISIGITNCSNEYEALAHYFIHYKMKYDSELKLVLVGKCGIDIDGRDDIICIDGLREDAERELLQGACCYIAPQSKGGYLDILKAMGIGIPVLAYGCDEITKRCILKSNAGLYFRGEKDFLLTLERLVTDTRLRQSMEANGRKYAMERHQWKDVIAKMCFVIMGVCENWQDIQEACKKEEGKI